MSEPVGSGQIDSSLVAGIVELVKKLYEPGSRDEVDSVQIELQQVQRSPAGWELANRLLQHENQHVRFFGALTYTVKINQEGQTLDEKDLLLLLEQLLGWLLRLIKQEEGLLVPRKLCSTLVIFFTLPLAPWRLCVRHIIRCLASGQVLPEETPDRSVNVSSLAQSLNLKQLQVVLIFVTTLAEDVARVDRTSQQFSETQQRVEANISDICTVLRLLLRGQEDTDRVRALQCYQAWVSYAREHIPDHSSEMQNLRDLVGLAMECLIPEDTFEAAAEFFIDMFVNGDTLLTGNDLKQFGAALLQSQWADTHMHGFRTKEIDEDVSRFGQLVLAFSQHICNRLVMSPEESQPILNIIHEITISQNFNNVDQALSNTIVDFWEEYASQIESKLQEGDTAMEYQLTSQQWLQAVEELCVATQLPTIGSEFVPLSSDTSLAEFRHRVKDAVQSSYDCFGIVLLQKLTTMAIHMHSRAKEYGLKPIHDNSTVNKASLMETISVLEAIFNCLGGLADSMHYQVDNNPKAEEDAILQQLFGSSMYADLTNLDITIPMKLRKRVINVLGEHVKFLGRNSQYLLRTIDVLLRCLVLPDVMEATARAISNLCDGNRGNLVSRLDLFLDVSEQFFAYPNSQQESRVYMAGAVASIVQAAPPGEQQGLATQRLLAMIERSYTATSKYDNEDPEIPVLNALNQLCSIGKSFQTPEDIPIDLDDDDETSTTSQTYWTQASGLLIQSQIIQFLHTLLTPFLSSGAILEAVCEVLKTGYRESSPGPFVLPASVTVSILTNTPLQNPRLDVAISTAATFVSTHNTRASNPDPQVLQAIHALLTYVTQITTHLIPPSTDPELAHASIDFLTRLLPHHIPVLTTLSPQTLHALFTFTLACLAGPDILPRRAAASFWSSLILLPSTSSAKNKTNAEAFTTPLLESFGQDLAFILIHLVAGKASRSDLDTLSEPLRRLVGTYPMPCKMWLERAMVTVIHAESQDDGGSGKERRGGVDEASGRRFIAQVLGLRGGAKTRSVVREFWLGCRGMSSG